MANTKAMNVGVLLMIVVGIIVLISFKWEHPTNQAIAQSINNQNPQTDPKMNTKLNKSEEEWKKELSDEEYRVLRQKGTERAFTGEYYDHHENGVYTCGACGQALFDSETKYESGSGWPSFYQPIDGIKGSKVEEIKDTSYGMVRREVVCSNCGSHLGHVFNDGPKPTGQRYCINSISLDFEQR